MKELGNTAVSFLSVLSQVKGLHEKRTSALQIFAVVCVSWAFALYLLRSEYNIFFLLQIPFASLFHYYLGKHFLGFLSTYLFAKIEKEKNQINFDLLDTETLCIFSTIPWLFALPFVLVIQALNLPNFFVLLSFLFLLFWSMTLIYQNITHASAYLLKADKASKKKFLISFIKKLAFFYIFPFLFFIWFFQQLVNFLS